MNEPIQRVTDCDYCGEIDLCDEEELGKICPKCIKAREERIKRITELMKKNN